MVCDIPEIIELASYGGDYPLYESAIYEIYRDNFHDEQLTFRGQPIRHKKYPEYKGKPATFWHIISNGSDEENRLPNLRRYERIEWPFYIIGSCVDNCERVLIWENTRKGKTNVLIYCPDVEYLVVLAKRDGYLVFWTAYPVEYQHTRNSLLKEYSEYMAKAAQS